MGLYDSYRLSNSTVIPQYVGSALPEYTKMLDDAQQKYDVASQADATMADNVLNIPFLKQDEETWKSINDQTQRELKQRIEAGNYEDLYGIVAQRARQTATKIKPLVEQVKAKQDYQTQLESKEFGLDPTQKAIYMQMADDGYKGIKYDEQGRAIGGFRGLTPVKNIDVNEVIRKNLSIMTANGGEVKQGGDTGWQKWSSERGWESIKPEDIKKVFDYARQNDKEWLAHNEQDLNLKTYAANRGLDDKTALATITKQPDTIPGTNAKGKVIQQSNQDKVQLMEAIKSGISPAKALSMYRQQHLEQKQYANQLGYALGKAYSKTKQANESGVGDLYKDEVRAATAFKYAKQLKDYEREQQKLEDTEVVESTITDPSGDYKNWDEFQTDVKNTDRALNETQTQLTAQKQSIARSLGTSVDKLTDAQITQYFKTNNQPESQALYEDRLGSLQELQRKRTNQKTIQGKLENDVLGTGQFGYTTSDNRRSSEKEAINNVLLEKPNDKVRIIVSNYTRNDQTIGSDGKPLNSNWQTLTRKEVADKLKDAKIVSTDKSWGINRVNFQTKDGSYISFQDNAVTGKIDDIVSNLGRKGKQLEAAKITHFNANHSNYAIPQAVVLESKKRSEQSKQEIMAAGTTNIQTINGTPVEDEKVAMAIAGGNFQYIGKTKGNGKQNTGGIIAVIDPETKQVTGQYKVNYSSSSALRTSDNLIKVGKRRDDRTMTQVGRDFNPQDKVQAFDTKHTADVVIKDGNGNIIAKVEKTRGNGKTSIRIRDANGNRITSIPETSLEAKEFIRHQMQNGATIEGLD
jgi:hypothetical protein